MSDRKAGKTEQKDHLQKRVSRRDLLKEMVGITLFGGSSILARSVSAEDVPPEPDNLDEPTPWQEGDPEPVEITIPLQEPEQASTEAPPSQPMDDERPPQPGPDYVWVTGYWWWTGGRYVWVPGYWVVPPEAEYVYIPGYWTYSGTTWAYVRGGWGAPNTRVIVVYPRPRPVFRVRVIHAPARIVQRHHRWRHYHTRRHIHRAAPVRHHPKPVKGPAKPGIPGKVPGDPAGPVKRQGGPGRRPRRR